MQYYLVKCIIPICIFTATRRTTAESCSCPHYPGSTANSIPIPAGIPPLLSHYCGNYRGYRGNTAVPIPIPMSLFSYLHQRNVINTRLSLSLPLYLCLSVAVPDITRKGKHRFFMTKFCAVVLRTQNFEKVVIVPFSVEKSTQHVKLFVIAWH